MLVKLYNDKPIRIFFLVAVALFILALIVEYINGRFFTNDFAVLYYAGEALVRGDVFYGCYFGLDSGFYKYSPFTLLVLTPYTLLSFKMASVLHFFVIAISGISAIILMENIVNRYLFTVKKYRLLIFILILISVLLHLVKDLHLGNTNTILIFILILVLNYALKRNDFLAGLFLAIAIFTKPYFIILLLPFILHKRYKTILFTAISGISFLFFTVVIFGFSKSLMLHIDWINSMLGHSTYLYSCYTFFYLFEYYLGFVIPIQYSYYFFFIFGFLSLLYFGFLKRKDKKGAELFDEDKSLIFFYFFLLAIIPNILITDNEHFIFSLPVIAIMIYYLSIAKNYWLIVLFSIFIIMYGGNSTDLVGHDLTLVIKYGGVLGIANLLILSYAMTLFYFKRNESKVP